MFYLFIYLQVHNSILENGCDYWVERSAISKFPKRWTRSYLLYYLSVSVCQEWVFVWKFLFSSCVCVCVCVCV